MTTEPTCTVVDADMESRRAAWAYLSAVTQGPCPALNELVTAVGVQEAARAVRERDLPAALRKRTEARRGIDRTAEHFETLQRIGGRLITPDDHEWPSWRMLSFAGMDLARDADGAVPLALWVRGAGSLSELVERSVAVVGTRAPSEYGSHVTGEISAELAAQGWTVVSGGAYGIDGAAHRAALTVDGRSLAVMACGVDYSYPAGHSRLFDAIARRGLVVSEYPPGTPPARHRFLTRNRLVAGFSEAVVVVEAGWRSGARNTAKWGRRLGRPVLAVPGPITTATSTGCHQMIREGEARLITCAQEVIDEAGPLRLPVAQLPARSRPTDRLRGNQLLVYEALPAVGSVTAGDLSERSGVPIGEVRIVLPKLEFDGFVALDESGWSRVISR